MIKKILFGLLLVILLLLTIRQFNKNAFSENLSPISKIEKKLKQKTGKIYLSKEIKIIITGDVMLGRSVMAMSLLKGIDYPFEKVAEVLKNADLTFVNLENPIIENCPISNDGMLFCTDPKMIRGLTFAGVDMVNLANNHTKNYGNNGLTQTQKYLNDEKIDYVGVNNLLIKDIQQTKFGFLGFDFLSNSPKESDYELIKQSKNKVDVLIVMIHWGVEYKSKANERQKNIAKKIIQAGADVIVGTHPHWVQDMEYIDGKPVFYSLGNFVFDQSWSMETKKGLAIRLNYLGKEFLGFDQLPIYMENFGQPNWVK